MNLNLCNSQCYANTLGTLDRNFCIIRKLRQSTNPVFLVKSDHKYYAMKVYCENQKNSHKYFLNESRFKSLSHKNIIRYVKAEENGKLSFDRQKKICSYIVMELVEYGDFARLIRLTSLFQDEVLLRTYFHQLLAGIEYLHSNGISHLNLKPENLLLGFDFQLKIADFSHAFKNNDSTIFISKSKNYRAPEIRAENCKDPQAADIYSLGIILFLFKTECFPYLEDTPIGEYNLQELLYHSPKEFWAAYKEISKQNIEFDEDFKELFLSMVRYDPVTRATLQEIKDSRWYNGPTYSNENLTKQMASLLKNSFHAFS